MGLGIEGALRPVTKMEVVGLPIGKAAVLTVAMGVGDVGKALAYKLSGNKVPQWLTGLGLAWAVVNIKGIKNLLGPEVAELVALGIIADSLDDQIDLRNRTSTFLGNLFGQQVVSKSPPVMTPRDVARKNIDQVMGRTGAVGV